MDVTRYREIPEWSTCLTCLRLPGRHGGAQIEEYAGSQTT
jgi:hypothetical protein